MILLLAKGQYTYVSNLFERNQFNIKEKFKPLYYALLQVKEGNEANESLKLGNEMKEIVESVKEKIERMAEDYN